MLDPGVGIRVFLDVEPDKLYPELVAQRPKFQTAPSKRINDPRRAPIIQKRTENIDLTSSKLARVRDRLPRHPQRSLADEGCKPSKATDCDIASVNAKQNSASTFAR